MTSAQLGGGSNQAPRTAGVGDYPGVKRPGDQVGGHGRDGSLLAAAEGSN